MSLKCLAVDGDDKKRDEVYDFLEKDEFNCILVFVTDRYINSYEYYCFNREKIATNILNNPSLHIIRYDSISGPKCYFKIDIAKNKLIYLPLGDKGMNDILNLDFKFFEMEFLLKQNSFGKITKSFKLEDYRKAYKK